MADAVQRGLVADGHLDARVVVRRAVSSRGAVDLCVAAAPGPRVTIGAVTFPGAHALLSVALLGAFKDRLLNHPGGRYDEEGLEADGAHVAAEYWEHGMMNVKVGEPKRARRGAKLDLAIPITEGPAFRIGLIAPPLGFPSPAAIRSGELAKRSRMADADTWMQAVVGDGATVYLLTHVDAEHAQIDLSWTSTGGRRGTPSRSGARACSERRLRAGRPRCSASDSPRTCAGRAGQSERCIGWILDRILIRRDVHAVPRPGASRVRRRGRRRRVAVRPAIAGRGRSACSTIRTRRPARTGSHDVYITAARSRCATRPSSPVCSATRSATCSRGHTHESSRSSRRTSRATRCAVEHVEAARDDEIQADEPPCCSPRAPATTRAASSACCARSPRRAPPGDDERPPPAVAPAPRPRPGARGALPAAGARNAAAFRARRTAPSSAGPIRVIHAVVGGALVFAALGLAIDLPQGLDADAVETATSVPDRARSADAASISARSARELARYITPSPTRTPPSHAIRAGPTSRS